MVIYTTSSGEEVNTEKKAKTQTASLIQSSGAVTASAPQTNYLYQEEGGEGRTVSVPGSTIPSGSPVDVPGARIIASNPGGSSEQSIAKQGLTINQRTQQYEVTDQAKNKAFMANVQEGYKANWQTQQWERQTAEGYTIRKPMTDTARTTQQGQQVPGSIDYQIGEAQQRAYVTESKDNALYYNIDEPNVIYTATGYKYQTTTPQIEASFEQAALKKGVELQSTPFGLIGRDVFVDSSKVVQQVEQVKPTKGWIVEKPESRDEAIRRISEVRDVQTPSSGGAGIEVPSAWVISSKNIFYQEPVYKSPETVPGYNVMTPTYQGEALGFYTITNKEEIRKANEQYTKEMVAYNQAVAYEATLPKVERSTGMASFQDVSRTMPGFQQFNINAWLGYPSDVAAIPGKLGQMGTIAKESYELSQAAGKEFFDFYSFVPAPLASSATNVLSGVSITSAEGAYITKQMLPVEKFQAFQAEGETIGKRLAVQWGIEPEVGQVIGFGGATVLQSGYLLADTYFTLSIVGETGVGLLKLGEAVGTKGAGALVPAAIKTAEIGGTVTKPLTAIAGASPQLQAQIAQVAGAGIIATGLGEATGLAPSDFGKGVVKQTGMYGRYLVGANQQPGEREEVVAGLTLYNLPYAGLKYMNVQPTGAKSAAVEIGYKALNVGSIAVLSGVRAYEEGGITGGIVGAKPGESGAFFGMKFEPVKLNQAGIVRGLGRAVTDIAIGEGYFEPMTYDIQSEKALVGMRGAKYEELVKAGKIKPEAYKSMWSSIEFTEAPSIKSGTPKMDFGKITEGEIAAKPEENKMELKFDVKEGIKYDIKLDTRPEGRPESKIEVSKVTLEPGKTDIGRVDLGREEFKYDMKEDIKEDIRPENKFDTKPDVKFDIMPGLGIPFLGFPAPGEGGGKETAQSGKAGFGAEVLDLLSISKSFKVSKLDTIQRNPFAGYTKKAKKGKKVKKSKR